MVVARVKSSLRLVAALLVAAVLPATEIALASWYGPAQSYDAALLVVLDVSGSMKEGVPGGVKRALASKGLLTTLRSLPPGTATALRLLGQGPGDDECAASTRAVDFAPFDDDTWSGALDTVRWDGATPLVRPVG